MSLLAVDTKLRHYFFTKNLEKLPNITKDGLIKIVLEAIKKAEDVKVNGKNLDVIIVGKDETTKLLRSEENDEYIKAIDNKIELS